MQVAFLISSAEEGGNVSSSESEPSSFRRKIFILVATLALAWSALLNGETGLPKYDLHTETKMKGKVEEVELPPKGSEKEVVHLPMKNGEDIVDLDF